MADKAINDLTQALQITNEDLFVLQQGGEAKKLKGATLLDFVTLSVISVTVTTLPTGSSATATYDKSTGTLALGIPQGSKGETGATGATGPANVLTIGSVTSGKVASATITGEAPNQVLNLVLEKGDKGDTGEKGETGDPGPKGEQGIQGPQGIPGTDAPTITGITIRQSDYHLIVTLSDGTSYDAGYCRGQAGAGTGDMLASVYDPNNKRQDIFAYVDNAINVGAVPTSRTVNGKALSANITLSASDVGADASGAAAAVQSNLDGHTGNTTVHITAAERTKWNGKQDKLTGAQGQVVGFDENGNAVAQNAPSGGGMTEEAADSKYLKLAGGDMSGKLTAPKIETGSGNTNYFQCRKFRGEGDANTYYHAIDFGYANHDRVDFHEYGGIWNFFKNTSGKAGEGSLCGKITTKGWEGDAKLTGSPTAPTPGTSDNSTRIATTAFVNSFNSTKLERNGDGSNVTAAFTAASSRTNISTGEKLSVLFGKIAKWLSDLGSLAFKSTVAKTDLASDVQTSLGKADSALQSVTKSDVGLGNVDNVKQYSASNPPPYPVTSVNGQIGDVEISADNVFAIEVDPTSSTPVVNKSFGEIKAAVQAGKLCVLTDGQLLYYCRSSPSDPMTSTIKFEIAVAIAARTYIGTININTDNTITRIYNDLIVSNNITEQNLVNTETTPTKNGAINWVYG